MCLHNAVEVSFLTTYIKKFWTQVCGQFSILTLHGTGKKTRKKKKGGEKKCDCIFPDSKVGRVGGEEAVRGALERNTHHCHSSFTLSVTKPLKDQCKR